MRFGLPSTTFEKIYAVLARYSQVEKAVLYGSRAKGNYKPGSDIDLTLFGTGLTLHVLAQLDQDLDDLLLPYTIDLSVFANLTNPDLVAHIQRVGIVVYEQTQQVA